MTWRLCCSGTPPCHVPHRHVRIAGARRMLGGAVGEMRFSGTSSRELLPMLRYQTLKPSTGVVRSSVCIADSARALGLLLTLADADVPRW